MLKALLNSIIFIILIFSISTVNAKPYKQTEMLVDGCIEIVGIYKNKKDKYLSAGATTSLTEAMKAGYCRGAIEQFIQSSNRACYADWFEIAERISKMKKKSYQKLYQSRVLELSCNG